MRISATRHLCSNETPRCSCGRMHTMALDSKNQIWTFVTWGRPFRLDSPMLDCTSPETTPMQAECGWSFSSILTKSGDVLAFWPSSGEIGRIYDEENAAMDEVGDCNAYGTEDRRIPCVTWSLRADPLRIPPIPQLPDLESTGVSQEEKSKATTLIKIAAFDNHLIGLTNKGHVLKFGDLSNEYSFDRTTRWQYVSHPRSALCSS
jgi:SCF-associated factor 1